MYCSQCGSTPPGVACLGCGKRASDPNRNIVSAADHGAPTGLSTFTLPVAEDFKCLHDRVVALDKQAADLVDGLKNLLGRLTGQHDGGDAKENPETPRVITETALSNATNNVKQAHRLLEQLRRRLYGE